MEKKICCGQEMSIIKTMGNMIHEEIPIKDVDDDCDFYCGYDWIYTYRCEICGEIIYSHTERVNI